MGEKGKFGRERRDDWRYHERKKRERERGRKERVKRKRRPIGKEIIKDRREKETENEVFREE
jgi:hypothetical protein